ncbi:MAG: prepilin-type N-terminal cleavage/methylation domain-containing protein [Candidatus Omnitrophica bacterium]|nr:prepilin-type N-terminal cleavage/methylation domain-containing protein [Candidatus Omnitrophota bacterium]
MSKGFSLLEVIVASAIFTVSIAVIYAAIGSISKQPAVKVTDTTRAALYGQQFLEGLRAEVNAAKWAGGASSLTVGGSKSMPQDSTNFPGFTGNYAVEDADGIRKVTLTITTPP